MKSIIFFYLTSSFVFEFIETFSYINGLFKVVMNKHLKKNVLQVFFCFFRTDKNDLTRIK